MTDPIYEKMDLAPIKKNPIELVPVDKTVSDSVKDDLDEARTNVQTLITLGDDALRELKSISSASQDPKAYREYSVLTKVLLDANKALVDIAKARHDINTGKTDQKMVEDNQTINNNLFVGSTSEALELIRKGNKE